MSVKDLIRLHTVVTDHFTHGTLSIEDKETACHELIHLVCSSHRFNTVDSRPLHDCSGCVGCTSDARASFLSHLGEHVIMHYADSRWWNHERGICDL